MNPIKYKANDVNKTSHKTAKFIWDSDQHKYDIARFAGYEVLVIWEHDYNANPLDTINKCSKFLSCGKI